MIWYINIYMKRLPDHHFFRGEWYSFILSPVSTTSMFNVKRAYAENVSN